MDTKEIATLASMDMKGRVSEKEVEEVFSTFVTQLVKSVSEGASVSIDSLGVFEKRAFEQSPLSAKRQIFQEDLAKKSIESLCDNTLRICFFPASKALNGKRDIREVAPSAHFMKTDAAILLAMLNMIKERIGTGERVTLPGFGTFCKEKDYDTNKQFLNFRAAKAFHEALSLTRA